MRPSPRTRAAAGGFTLTEVMIVVVLAGVVTLGLLTFYLNSQIMWTGASTQVMAQRDATALIELMRRSAQTASSAQIDNGNTRVIFFDGGTPPDEIRRFYLSPADSLVHSGDAGNVDQGPVTPTTVESFQLSYDPNLGLLTIDSLKVRSKTGERVRMSTTMGLYNR